MHIDKTSTTPLLHLACFVIVIAGIKAAGVLIVPFLLAVFIAITCLPLLLWLEKRGIPEIIRLLLIIALFIALWTLFATLLGTTLGDFTRSVPAYQERLRVIVGEAWQWLKEHGIVIDRAMLEGVFNPGKLMSLLAGALNSLGSILKDAFLILLIFVFLLLEISGIPRKIQAIHAGQQDALKSYHAILSGINRYLAIKSLTSLATGLIIFTFLKLQGVDYPILWGVVAFVLNYIPAIGSLIAAVPPVILALVQFGPGPAAATALGFLIVNTLIGSIIEPRVMGKGVGLSALVVFLSLTFWGWVLGPVGMLLSVPLTLALKIGLAEKESTQWIAIVLGSNKDVNAQLEKEEHFEQPDPGN